jgi:excisionase family DNA binding protein
MAEQKLLTPAQVAERLQIHERTVTRWLREGYLRGFKLGKEWRIAPSDLMSFMDRHANQPLDTASGS